MRDSKLKVSSYNVADAYLWNLIVYIKSPDEKSALFLWLHTILNLNFKLYWAKCSHGVACQRTLQPKKGLTIMHFFERLCLHSSFCNIFIHHDATTIIIIIKVQINQLVNQSIIAATARQQVRAPYDYLVLHSLYGSTSATKCNG